MRQPIEFDVIEFTKSASQLRLLMTNVSKRDEVTTVDVEAFLQLYGDQITTTLDAALRNFIERKLA